MHDEFYRLTEKLKNILRSLYGFGRRCQESELDLCSSLDYQTWSNNQSQLDFIHGGVSL